VGLEQGPLSLVSITEELLEWKSSGSRSTKPRLMVVGVRCANHVTPSIRKSWHLYIHTSLTSGGRSVGIVRLRTNAMETTQRSYEMRVLRKVQFSKLRFYLVVVQKIRQSLSQFRCSNGILLNIGMSEELQFLFKMIHEHTSIL
jgi:hypothetical protein